MDESRIPPQTTVKPHEVTDPALLEPRHHGEEFVVVLDGRVLLELEGSAPIVLDRDESAYYESDRPHRWSNAGKGIARVLSVSTQPDS
jgi:quercetin dioxygenase-like cupin family protein